MTAAPSTQPGASQRAFHFPLGIPAFEQHTQFRLIESPDFAPLIILQSEGEPRVRFACTPVRLIVQDYAYELAEEEIAVVGPADAAGKLLAYAILTFRDGAPPTANLLAPIVLNPATGKGIQSVQADSTYSHVHPLRRQEPCL